MLEFVSSTDANMPMYVIFFTRLLCSVAYETVIETLTPADLMDKQDLSTSLALVACSGKVVVRLASKLAEQPAARQL